MRALTGLLVGAASGALMWAGPVAAQTQAAPGGASAATDQTATSVTAEGGQPADQIGDIVVTANKTSESLSKVPMSITAITGADLINRGVVGVADLQKVVPGFRASQSLTGTPVYFLRGIGYYDDSFGGRPTVTTYVDEVPLPFPVETLGVATDLERVEVLKGPQGILFGQNSTGGAINFIAAKPTSDLRAGGGIDFGSFNAFTLRGYVSGPLSDNVRMRLSLEHQGGDAWQQSYTRSARLGEKNLTVGRFQIDADVSDRLTLKLGVNGFANRSDTQAGQLLAYIPQNPANVPKVNPGIVNFPLSPMTPRAADWDVGADLRHHDWFVQGSLRADYTLTDALTLTSLSAYSHFKSDYYQDVDGSSYQGSALKPNGTIDNVFQEVRIAGNVTDTTRLTVGGNYSFDDVKQKSSYLVQEGTTSYALTSFGTAPYPVVFMKSFSKSNIYAAFANVDQKIGSDLTFHAGARYTKAITDFTGGTGCGGDLNENRQQLAITAYINFLRGRATPSLGPISTIPAGGCTIADPVTLLPAEAMFRLSEDNVSWRVGLDYQITPSTLLYANVNKGYKAGSFPAISALLTSAYLPAKQEAVLAYEAGFKTRIGSFARLAGAAFYYDYNDKQIFGSVADPVATVLKKLVNIPKSRIVGAEIDATLYPFEGLTVNGGLTYVDSKIKAPFVNYTRFAVLQDFAGEPFPFTPKWQGSADVEYKWAVGGNASAFVGGSASAQSETYAGLGQVPIQYIKGYALFDLRAGVRLDNSASLTIWAKNIGNRYYWLNADRYGDAVVRFAGRPRTVGLTLNYDFR